VKFAELLVDDIKNLQNGTAHEELQWIDVQLHACRILNAKESVIFLTADDIINNKKYVSYAENEGYGIVLIPDNLKDKLSKVTDIEGASIRDLDVFVTEWQESFVYEFVDFKDLNKKEQIVFSQKEKVIKWFPKVNNIVKAVLISNTMQPDMFGNDSVFGLWDGENKHIIVNRNQLKREEDFLGTLIHEIVHALTKADDETIEFENELTSVIGMLSKKILS